MKNLEQLVARFLDGEMSTEEESRFRQHLLTSAQARERVREMALLRREARRLPLLHAPSAKTEAALFHRLAVEGFGAPIRADRHRRRAAAYLSGAFAILLLLVVGRGLLPEHPDQASVAWGDFSSTLPGSITHAGKAPIAPIAPVHAIDHRYDRVGDTKKRSAIRFNGMSDASRPAVRAMPDRGVGIAVPPDTTHANDEHSPALARRDTSGVNRSLPNVTVATDTSGNTLAPIIDPPDIAREGREATGLGLIASLQGGGSRMNRADGLIISEAQVRVGLEAWDGGRLSIVVGSYPSVTEEKHTNTSFILSSPAGVEHRPTDAPPSAHRIILEDEAWFGLALRQRIARLGTMEVEAGGSVGASKSAFHLSEEVLVSQRVTSIISLEGGVTLSHMIPYDQSIQRFQVFDSPDRFIYNGVRQQPAFSSVGCQVGVRFVLDPSR